MSENVGKKYKYTFHTVIAYYENFNENFKGKHEQTDKWLKL